MPYGFVYTDGRRLSPDETQQLEEAIGAACLLFDCDDVGGRVTPDDVEVVIIDCSGTLTAPLIVMQARSLPARLADWDDRQTRICKLLTSLLPMGVEVVVRFELVQGYVGLMRAI